MMKMTPELTVITLRDHPEMRPAAYEIMQDAWPQFMLHDAVARRYWGQLYDRFSKFQYVVLDRNSGHPIGVGNSLPFVWQHDLQELPEEGWDWAVRHGCEYSDTSGVANVLCAVSITVGRNYQGRGIGSYMVNAMKAIGVREGVSTLIAPVRPSNKSAYPLVPLSEYVTWKDDGGLPFDPWLRIHVRAGGDLVKICSRSMRIVGSLSDWGSWTGLRFPTSGKYLIPGALVPVDIRTEEDIGTYEEPNVWIKHKLIP